MVTINSRNLSPHLAPIRVPIAFPAITPYSIQTSESLAFVLDTTQLAERLFQSRLRFFTLRPGIGKNTL